MRQISGITASVGPICLKYWWGTLSLAYIPFGVRFICIVCIAYGHSAVDRKDRLFTFCTLCSRVIFTFHIYPNTISCQAATGPENDIIFLPTISTHLTFICKFYIFISFFFKIEKPLKKAKAERPKVKKSFALLKFDSQHVVERLSFQHPFRIQCYQTIFC